MWHQREPANSECPAKASGGGNAIGDRGAPAIDDGGDAARLQGVEADLVQDTAELARFELRRKRRRQKDFSLCSTTNSRVLGGQPCSFCKLGADAGALLEILGGGDNPVQRADLGVPAVKTAWRGGRGGDEPLLELANRAVRISTIMDFSGVVSAADEPSWARITSFPRHGAATMDICGVFGHMEQICQLQPKTNHGHHKKQLNYGIP